MSNLITMSQFGRHGRAGNQLFQYAFLSMYSRKYKVELQLPDWIGVQLFGTSDPPISRDLPQWLESGSGRSHPVPPEGDEVVGRDFRGYAQYHTSYYRPGKVHFVKTFQPTGRVYDRLKAAQHKLLSGDDVVVGIHLRRGDYGRGIFPIIPTSWYLDWLESNTHLLGNLRLFIATEDPSLVDDFAKYGSQTAESLGVPIAQEWIHVDRGCLARDVITNNVGAIDWYPDFYLLSQCHVILGPSSTFSFMAAMLAPRLLEYWRASLKTETFVQTDPWDAYPQLREHVRDYSHLEGISLKNNPYW